MVMLSIIDHLEHNQDRTEQDPSLCSERVSRLSNDRSQLISCLAPSRCSYLHTPAYRLVHRRASRVKIGYSWNRTKSDSIYGILLGLKSCVKRYRIRESQFMSKFEHRQTMVCGLFLWWDYCWNFRQYFDATRSFEILFYRLAHSTNRGWPACCYTSLILARHTIFLNKRSKLNQNPRSGHLHWKVIQE